MLSMFIIKWFLKSSQFFVDKKLNSDQEKTPLAQSEDLGNSLHNVQKLLKRNEVKILYFRKNQVLRNLRI